MQGTVSAESFWQWFVDNENRFRQIDDSNSGPLLDEMEAHLHRFCSELFFEIGGEPNGPSELIITAEGAVNCFPYVRALVKKAPILDGWRIVAFKPPMGFEFSTRHGSVRVNAGELWFRPLKSATHPESLGLLIGVPGYDRSLRDDYLFAVTVALRTALGELTWAQAVHYVDVGPLQGAQRKDRFMRITELPRYIEWKQRRSAREN